MKDGGPRTISLAGGSSHVGKPATAAAPSPSSASSVVARVDRHAVGGSRDRDCRRSNLLRASDAGVSRCVDAVVASGAAADPRQRVAGPSALAPGATAFVSGPHGRWLGGDEGRRHEHVDPDAVEADAVGDLSKMRGVLFPPQEGKPVDDRSPGQPGLLAFGERSVGVPRTTSSGLIDNNDFINATGAEKRAYLARVKDATLRRRLLATPPWSTGTRPRSFRRCCGSSGRPGSRFCSHRAP